ncbi:hypothetical protein LCGC14_1568040 [marine sediment metagenome]|uniref:Uncharacterized protein n=1 Tax=marine sediment metagenome TaxID=412755 RepID=A0A0F9IKG7_9ZZZZ
MRAALGGGGRLPPLLQLTGGRDGTEQEVLDEGV